MFCKLSLGKIFLFCVFSRKSIFRIHRPLMITINVVANFIHHSTFKKSKREKMTPLTEAI